MSFATLKRNQKDLMSKLKEEATKLKDPDKKGYEDDRYWNLNVINLVTVMQLSDSYHNVKVRICLGFDCGIMVFKDQVVGTLRIH